MREIGFAVLLTNYNSPVDYNPRGDDYLISLTRHQSQIKEKPLYVPPMVSFNLPHFQ